GLSIDNLTLSRDGIPISLANATLVGSGTSFTLIGLHDLTMADGNYTFTITAPGPANEPGRTPVPAVAAWTRETTAPPARRTPTVGPKGVVDSVTITFSSPVNGLDISDFSFMYINQDPLALSLATATLTAGSSPNTFVLSNLAGIYSASGDYRL